MFVSNFYLYMGFISFLYMGFIRFFWYISY
jgi:hypothetical protein